MTKQTNGLYLKYNITKSSGEPLAPTFEGFVLRLDSDGDKAHVRASLKALMTYADEIERHLPELANDLREQYSPLLDKFRAEIDVWKAEYARELVRQCHFDLSTALEMADSCLDSFNYDLDDAPTPSEAVDDEIDAMRACC